jgi:hypothetical protein
VTEPSDAGTPARPGSLPGALSLAAVLVFVQGLGLLVLAVVGLVDLNSARRGVGVSVAAFFALYGGLLLACAWALTRRRGWARGPVLITQLIQLGIAWNARENLLLAVPLALAAVLVVAVMVQPATIDALQPGPSEGRE